MGCTGCTIEKSPKLLCWYTMEEHCSKTSLTPNAFTTLPKLELERLCWVDPRRCSCWYCAGLSKQFHSANALLDLSEGAPGWADP